MPKDLFYKSLFFCVHLPFHFPGNRFVLLRFTRPGEIGEFQELTRGTWWGATGSFRAQVRCFAGWRGGCCHDGSMGLVNVYLEPRLGGFTFKTRGHWGIYILTYLNGWFSWLMLNVCKYTPQDRRNFEYLWQENALGKSKFRDSVIFKNVFYGFLYSKMFFSLVVWTFLLGQAQVINPAHVSHGCNFTQQHFHAVQWTVRHWLEIQWSTAIGFWEMSFRCSRLKKDIKASQ